MHIIIFLIQSFCLTALHYFLIDIKYKFIQIKKQFLNRKISKVYQWKSNFISNSIYEEQIINSIISKQSTRERLNKRQGNH